MSAPWLLPPVSLDAMGRDEDGERLAERIPDPSPGPAEVALARVSRERLAAIVAGLPPEEMAVIQSRYWGGMGPREVARQMGCSLGEVLALEAQALESLRGLVPASFGV